MPWADMDLAEESFYSDLMTNQEPAGAEPGEGVLDAEDWYDLIVEASADGSWFFDIDKDRIHYSPSFLDILDIRSESGPLAPQDFLDRIHDDDRDNYKRTLTRHLKGETESFQVEIRVLSDDGSLRWILSRGIARHDNSGRAYCMFGSVVDITRRKQLEESLRAVALSTTEGTGTGFFESLVRYLSEALSCDFAIVGRLENEPTARVNTVAVYQDGGPGENFEYELENTPCWNVVGRQTCVYPRDVTRLFPRDELLIESGIEGYIGSPLLDSSGDSIGIIAALFRKPVFDTSTAEDLLKIFAARAAAELERQTKVEALRDSEQRFKDFAEAASDWFWEMGPDLRFSYLSDRIEEIAGVSAGHFIGKTRREVMAFTDTPEAQKHLRDIEAHRPFRDFVYQISTFENARYFKISGRPVFGGDGTFLGYRGTGTDITDIKRAEEALRRYEDIVSASSDCMAYVGHGYIYDLVNEPYAGLFGKDIGDVVGKPVWEVVGRRAFEARVRPLMDRAYAGETSRGSHWLDPPGGGRRYFDVFYYPRVEQDGSVPGVAIVARDVTDLKKTEDELRRSQARLSEAQRVADLGSFEWDIDSGEIMCSPEILRIFGLPSGEAAFTHDRFMESVHPDDRQRILNARLEVVRDRAGPYQVEHRITRPNGDVRVVQERGELVQMENREKRLVSAVQDITERVQKEQALARSEQRYRELYNRTPVMLHSIDHDGRIVAVSEYWLRHLGYSEEDVLDRPLTDFMTEESRRRAREQVLPDFFARGVTNSVSYQLVKANGEVVDVLLSAVAQYDSGGNIDRSLAVMTDVTDQRRAESEYRDIFNNATEGIYRTSPDGRLLRANPALVRMHGLDSEAALVESATDIATQWYVDPADRARILKRLNRDGRVLDFEVAIRRIATGERIWVNENARVVRDDNGAVAYYEGTIHDITERRRLEADYRVIFDNVGEGIYRSTPDGKLVRANPALARLQGFDTPEELIHAIGNLDTDWYLHAGTRAEIKRLLSEQGFVDDFVAEVKLLNGDERIWTSETVRMTSDVEGNVLYFEGSVRDITADYKARQLARSRDAVLEMIARDAPLPDILQAIVEVVKEQEDKMVAGIFRMQGGRLYRAAAPGLSGACVDAIDGSTPAWVDRAVQAALEGVQDVIETRLEDSSETGGLPAAALESGYGSVLAAPLRDQNDGVLGVLVAFVKREKKAEAGSFGVLREMAQIASIAIEQHRLSEALRRQAHYDSLTGLPNRILLSDRLERAIREADRGEYPVGVLLLDLDEFKLVNDSLGHGAGDELLQEVSVRLQDCLRAGDTVGRLGGDEFVVVVSLKSGEDYCTDVAERLMSALQRHVHAAGHEVNARPSIGISLYPHDGDSPETLLQAADTAMYAAKHAGKNQYRFFAEEMNRQVSERLRIESELQDALRNQELELYYQPRVLVANGDVCGAEALLRWHHPRRGFLNAGQFIGIAERSPLMGAIDRVVLTQAARRLAAWQREGRNLVLSVNVSARELHADGFAEQVAATLEDAGVDAAGLELEITESMLMQDYERTRRQLADLKERAPGLRIAIDDFGSGYSSLNYLRQLPIDTLKIDRSFIADIDGAEKVTAGAITRTIVDFGLSLGLTVVAEGVERAEQAQYLRIYRCHQAQGFLYHAALSVEEFETRFPAV